MGITNKDLVSEIKTYLIIGSSLFFVTMGKDIFGRLDADAIPIFSAAD